MKKLLTEAQQLKISKIKLVITDVDGVLTDGGLYYSKEGLTLKKFNVKDGMGVFLLRENGIKNAIVTTATSELMKKRAEALSIEYYYSGVWDKENKLLEICKIENIQPENIAFIGDDVNDLSIINLAGFTAAPIDAIDKVKEAVDIILSKKGGDGVFREFAELILSVQKLNS